MSKPLLRVYLEMMRTHVDEGGRLSHGNGLQLLEEVERLNALVNPAAGLLAALRPFAVIGLDVLENHAGWANHVFSAEWASYRIAYVDFERAAAAVLAARLAASKPQDGPRYLAVEGMLSIEDLERLKKLWQDNPQRFIAEPRIPPDQTEIGK